MSRYIVWNGRKMSADLFNSLLDERECPRCGGAGVTFEVIDEERVAVAVPCDRCKTFCKTCNSWVNRSGHQCKPEGVAS